MGNDSSKPRPTAKISKVDEAMWELKKQRDKLKDYKKQLENVFEKETQVAKTCLAKGDRRRAMLALRKKKYQETLIQRTDEQLFMLEKMVDTIQYKEVEKKFLDSLAQGNEVLKRLNAETSVEKVDALMQDTADAIAYQKEVSDAIGSSLTDRDEADVEAELERLVEEESAGIVGELPEVPTTVPVVQPDQAEVTAGRTRVGAESSSSSKQSIMLPAS